MVATGILSGGGYGMIDINQIGFRNETYRIMCYSSEGLLKEDGDLRIEVEPMNLWYVEKR